MRLKKVTLNNFRCFENLEIELHPRLTILVGRNGGGKTSVLDGISIGLSPVLRHLSSANQRLSGVGIKDTDFRLLNSSTKGGKERILAAEYAQVIVETYQGLKWDVWRPSAAKKEPPKKIGEVELSKKMSKILESISDVKNDPEPIPVFSYYGAQRGIEIPERLRPLKINYSHPVTALLDTLNAKSDFREMLQWFDKEEANELRENKGSRAEDYMESTALSAVRVAVNMILGGDYSNPRFNADHRFVVDAKIGPSPLQVSQLSQGYQSMLALAMDFARRMAIANGHIQWSFHSSFESDVNDIHIQAVKELKELCGDWYEEEASYESAPLILPGVMLIDEIDLHLHPGWQQRVLGDLMRAFPTTQFIVTTHSPQVLSAVPSECIRILNEGRIFSAPAGTEGAEPSRILKQVLGLDDIRPPRNHATEELREYLSLVDADQWSSPHALELRKILDARYQGNEPDLLEADLRIENRKWELGE